MVGFKENGQLAGKYMATLTKDMKDSVFRDELEIDSVKNRDDLYDASDLDAVKIGFRRRRISTNDVPWRWPHNYDEDYTVRDERFEDREKVSKLATKENGNTSSTGRKSLKNRETRESAHSEGSHIRSHR